MYNLPPIPHILSFYLIRPLSFLTKAFIQHTLSTYYGARHHNNGILASNVSLQPSNLPHCSHSVVFLLKNFKWLLIAYMIKSSLLSMASNVM